MKILLILILPFTLLVLTIAGEKKIEKTKSNELNSMLPDESILKMESIGLIKPAKYLGSGVFDILEGKHEYFVKKYLNNPSSDFVNVITESSIKFASKKLDVASVDIVAYYPLSSKSFIIYYIANTSSGPYGFYFGGFSKEKGVFINTIAIDSDMFKILDNVKKLIALESKITLTLSK